MTSEMTDRSSLVTVVAIAVVAYACSDAVHEIVGHGTVALILGIKITAISSVGLQSYTSSRLLSAAGSVANIVAGLLCFLSLRRREKFDETGYIAWLFGFVNAMNGSCYLLASAVLNTGDWSVVIAGRNPPWAWRLGMGLIGAALYSMFVRWAGTLLGTWVELGAVDRTDISRLTVPAYLAGGILMTFASVFNPYGPGLILLSGVGASFGLTWGLLLIPSMVEHRRPGIAAQQRFLVFNWKWVALGAIVGIAFVAFFGPGVRFA